MKHLRFKTFLKTITTIFGALMMGYYSVPIILNYPKYSENPVFQLKIDPSTHLQQYMVSGIIVSIAMLIIISILYRDIFKFVKGKYQGNLQKIRQQCFKMPKRMLILFYMVVSFILIMLYFTNGAVSFAVWLKMYIVYVTLFLSVSLFLNMWIEDDLKKIIVLTFKDSTEINFDVKKTKFENSSLLLIMPLTVVIFVIILLYSYSQITSRTGQAGHVYYNNELNNLKITATSQEDLKSQLEDVKKYTKSDFYFIIDDQDNINVSSPNQSLTKFMVTYIKDFSIIDNGRSYDHFDVSKQAYVKTIIINNRLYYYGYVFSVTSNQLIFTYLFIFFIALGSYSILIFLWSRSTAKNIKGISANMLSIANGEKVDLDKKLPITANDEIGELIYAYNKIQDLNKKYIESINQKQEMLVKQGQMVTLGELAGGMAHDINTPISAISTGITMLEKDLTKEQQVEIIKTMRECTDKIIKIVNDLRNQIRNIGAQDNKEFKLIDSIQETLIIVSSKAQEFGCNINVNIDESITLYGEVNKFGQVIMNILVNALQAYGRNPRDNKQIDVKANIVDNNAIIKISDQAGGIPEKIQKTLFKEIMTTKGTEGTGIGMYLAYSIIKGGFNGEITFETEKDKGTTFIITIPINHE